MKIFEPTIYEASAGDLDTERHFVIDGYIAGVDGSLIFGSPWSLTIEAPEVSGQQAWLEVCDQELFDKLRQYMFKSIQLKFMGTVEVESDDGCWQDVYVVNKFEVLS